MLHYILQTVVFQILFLMVYDLFLKKETFLNWNRFYLLTSVVLSIVLPFVKLNSFKTIIPKEYIVELPEIIIGTIEDKVVESPVLETINSGSGSLLSWDLVICLGGFIAILLFTYKLSNILLLANRNPKVEIEDAFLVQLSNSKSAFSFFNYIFIGEHIVEEERSAIIAHEQVHVKEKHSVDLLLFELLRILFWFNPMIYIYQNKIGSIHEFLADDKAVKANKAAYYQNLLSQVFQTQKVSFINPFFKRSLIKKRIVMLNKTKSKQINLIKYALLIPMIFGMMVYTSCSKVQEDSIASIANDNLEQYSYSLEKGEKMSDEKKSIQKKAEDFLKANNEEYAYWGSENNLTRKTTYSVHKISDKAPETHNEIDFTFKDGGAFKAFIQIGSVTNHIENVYSMDVLDSNKSVIERNDWVSFNVIDEVPVFPGCESLIGNEDRKKCFSKNVQKLVTKNFNVDIGKSLDLKGNHKISVFFIISKEGYIKDLKARAAHKSLEIEAKRVINLIPKLIPGKMHGENVDVAYYLPIKLNINE